MRGFIFECFLVLFCSYVVYFVGARSGPFKSTDVRVEKCSHPTLPVDPNPPLMFFAEVYNSSIIAGKITILREHRIKKMKAKFYIWDKNKWKVNYQIHNTGCNRVFFPAFVAVYGVKYDIKTCTFYKGEYSYNNLNMNKMEHMWMKTQEYGRLMWSIELFSEAGTVLCWEFKTLIKPADN